MAEDKGDNRKDGQGSLIADLLANKQFRTIMLAAIVISVGFMVLGQDRAPWQFTASNPVSPKPAEVTQVTGGNGQLAVLEKELENKLQSSLSRIDGVGQVLVSVSLSSGLKSEYARNESVTKRTTKSTDKNNGSQETTEETGANQIVLPTGGTQPVVVLQQGPQVAGVLVVAEGAKDARIRENINTAVRTLLGIPISKIVVEPMGGVTNAR